MVQVSTEKLNSLVQITKGGNGSPAMESYWESKTPLPINLILSWETKHQVTMKEQNQEWIFCVIQAHLRSVIAHMALLMP